MKKIVWTGGPGAGKTSALPLLKKKLEDAGVEAGILTETATEVLAENISPDTVGLYCFQKEIFERQIRKESEWDDQKPELLLLDRGLGDHEVYLGKGLYERLLQEERMQDDEINSRYNGVVIMETSATLGCYKQQENNALRLEDDEQARKLDELFVQVWRHHPHTIRIPACSSFEDKVEHVFQAVCLLSGIEFLDVVDDRGEPTGQIVSRTYAHANKVMHRTSHVWFLREREEKLEVLLQMRSYTKSSFPGQYDISSAGHIPAGSSYRTSAVREIKEELGIDVLEAELVECMDRKVIWDDRFFGREFHDRQISKVFYVVKDVDEDVFRLQKEEVDHVRWMDLEECIDAVIKHTIPNCIAVEELESVKSTYEKAKRKKGL